MMNGWNMSGWGWGWMAVVMILSALLVALLVVLLLRGVDAGPRQDVRHESSAELLDKRLARGEITEDEYRHLRRVLTHEET